MDATLEADKTYHAPVGASSGSVGGVVLFDFEPFNGPDERLRPWYVISDQVVPDANGAQQRSRAG